MNAWNSELIALIQVALRNWLVFAGLLVIIVSTAFYAAILYLKKQDRIRIVRNDTGGALMAVDADGLGLLNEYRDPRH